jgi:hypothetical protein
MMKMMIFQEQVKTKRIPQKITAIATIKRYQHCRIEGKNAKLENTQLDEKQYIAYEMIACTFLLGLVMDGLDSNTTLFACLQQRVGPIIKRHNRYCKKIESKRC